MTDSQEAQPNWNEIVAGLREAVRDLPNAELLAAVDAVLLELEKRMLHYAKVGPQMVAMADEGLALTVRAGSRLGQAQSAASHATGHLQVVGVGEWRPRSTNPTWSDDSRVQDGES